MLAIEKFFRNRGIDISLPPAGASLLAAGQGWAAANQGEVVSASFWYDFARGSLHYASGTGGTYVTMHPNGTILFEACATGERTLGEQITKLLAEIQDTFGENFERLNEGAGEEDDRLLIAQAQYQTLPRA
jgi:hypothetical protein